MPSHGPGPTLHLANAGCVTADGPVHRESALPISLVAETSAPPSTRHNGVT